MEEIELLRAKAIASMVSSSSNSSVKRKSPDSKEEGELSPELPICSNALSNSTMLENNAMIEAADGPPKSKPDYLTGPIPNTVPSKISCATKAPSQPSASRTYNRNFKTMQVPSKSNNNQSHLWQKKASDDNLVISFSDDDSTSSSSDKSNAEVLMKKNDIKVSKPEKTSNNKDIVARASTMPAPVSSSRVLQGKIITKSVPMKGSVYNGKLLASSVGKYTPNSGYNTKTKATAIHNLRHQISVQENGNKFHGKQLASQTVEIKAGDVRGPAPIDVSLAPWEQMPKRIKHSAGTSSRNNKNENNVKWQHADIAITQSSSENLPPGNVNTSSTPEVSSKRRNIMDANSPVIDYKRPHLQSGSNIEDASHFMGGVSPHRSTANMTVLHQRNFAKPGPINSFNSLPSKMPGQRNDMETQLILSTNGTNSLERISDSNENTDDTFNFTTELNISREASMRFQTLIEMEDLLDKELEQAQELRCRCELEERRALKVYREAQRALLEANEKCNLLYSKRDFISAKHRVLPMQSHGKTASGNALAVPGTRCGLLDVHDFTSSQFSEQNDENCPLDHNRPIESRLAREGNQSKKIAKGTSHDENLEDYQLLEASLRSKLVKRLGSKIVSKCDNTGEAEHLVKERVLDEEKEGVLNEDAIVIKSPCLHDQTLNEVDKIDALYTEGIVSEECRRTPHHQIEHSPSHKTGDPLDNEFHRIENSQDNSCSLEESCLLILKIDPVLPSSDLHIVSKYAKSALCGISNELSSTTDNETLLHVETTKCVIDEESKTLLHMKEFAHFGKIELHNYEHTVDPLWPFCMFDLRGKCNNEACKWQHVQSVKSYSDISGINSLNASKSDDICKYQILPIPTYNIGWNPIKGDSCTTRSLLSRSNWQFWQRDSCSFSFPSNIQRCLYPDANNRDWTRPYSYDQIQNSFMKQLDHGSPDYENKLEMALDHFYGSSCKPDRKKSLEVLSRSIETDPTSVVVWIIYLHIYYGMEKNIGKHDLFFHAVQINKDSYELWLMYINSRIQADDQLNAYEMALTTLCCNDHNKDPQHISACILDICLQMFDFFCMSGNAEKAIQKIYGLLHNSPSDPLLSDVHSSLTISDECLFWLCCIYLTIYKKLPQIVAQQLEYRKEPQSRVEWPCVQLTAQRKEQSLNLMRLAVDKITADSNNDSEPSISSLHTMAIYHVRCVAALEGLDSSYSLLAKYLEMYPTSIELHLLSARSNDNFAQDEDCNNHCLWNQYVEHALANNKIDLAETLINRWYETFCKDTNQQDWEAEKDVFALLNLSLHKTLQKDTKEAKDAVVKALELASPQDYAHCAREHAAFTLAYEQGDKPWCRVLSLVNSYLGDRRATPVSELLSRKYLQRIKKPTVRQLVSRLLGSVLRDFTLVNSVLEACFSAHLLPENVDDLKGFVDFVESLMEITPANYRLALSVCRVASKSTLPVKFWAGNILCTTMLQAVPVPPEHAWLEAADFTKELENAGVSLKFLKQAVIVYPFSVKLWRSCLDACRRKEDAESVAEDARQRGFELSRPLI